MVGSGTATIKDFTDLQAWKLAKELSRKVFTLTRKYPAEEKFGLTSQTLRAASSVTANIAEGYGRYSYQENLQFCRQARGSAYELRDHLMTARDAEYLSNKEWQAAEALALRVIQVINGYIRATRLRQKAKAEGAKT